MNISVIIDQTKLKCTMMNKKMFKKYTDEQENG